MKTEKGNKTGWNSPVDRREPTRSRTANRWTAFILHMGIKRENRQVEWLFRYQSHPGSCRGGSDHEGGGRRCPAVRASLFLCRALG